VSLSGSTHAASATMCGPLATSLLWWLRAGTAQTEAGVVCFFIYIGYGRKMSSCLWFIGFS